jgi:hypothetical protein
MQLFLLFENAANYALFQYANATGPTPDAIQEHQVPTMTHCGASVCSAI